MDGAENKNAAIRQAPIFVAILPFPAFPGVPVLVPGPLSLRVLECPPTDVQKLNGQHPCSMSHAFYGHAITERINIQHL